MVKPQILGVKYYPDGSLLRGPNWKIYLIINGRRQFIKNWGELHKKHKGQKINNVSYEILAQYPEILGVKIYANGSLLRGPDQKIYLLAGGRKQPVASLKELLNYKGRKINDVSQEFLIQYPDVLGGKDNIKENLFRGPDKKVYLIIDGKRKPIRNLEELINYRGREIIDVNNETLENFPQI